MDVSTTAGPSGPLSSFSHDDWVDIKQLFVKACEQYEGAFSGLERLCVAVMLIHCHTASEPAEALPLFRAIIHECHRCLLVHPDPSVLFFPLDAQLQEHATRSITPFSCHSWVNLLI